MAAAGSSGPPAAATPARRPSTRRSDCRVIRPRSSTGWRTPAGDSRSGADQVPRERVGLFYVVLPGHELPTLTAVIAGSWTALAATLPTAARGPGEAHAMTLSPA